MADISIRGDLMSSLAEAVKPRGGGESDKGSFGAALKDAVGEINRLQLDADRAITNVEMGNTGSIHEAIVALEKAEISFKTMMVVRNKILEAYQEIMRMQV
ncbi:MAG: flagellar hook-basal body complex protein FliE [Proteobacteria bacterium]|nr:flagellar hook-basal body complex protein FliE [Pseudomonadota bacterium]